MKRLILIAALLSASCFVVGGFNAGELWQTRVDQKSAVAVNAAHWNPKTAEFTWGSAESANLMALNLDEVMQPKKQK